MTRVIPNETIVDIRMFLLDKTNITKKAIKNVHIRTRGLL